MAEQPSALERLRQLEAQKVAAARAAVVGPAAQPAKKRGPVAGALTALGVLVWKLKALLFLVLKFAKFATTGFTMLLMALVYARYYGFGFAFGLVFLILLHELGHGWAAKQQGIAVGAPVFIPFFGAFIALKEKPRSTWQDFFIGAGGPVAGSLAGAVTIAVSRFVGGEYAGMMLAVGYFSLIMNLFNLTPFWTLDGARMIGPLTLRASIIGTSVLVLLLALATWRGEHLNPIALIVVAVGGYRAFERYFAERNKKPHATPLEKLNALSAEARKISEDGVTDAQRNTAALVYFGLAAILILATHELPALLPQMVQ
ncbi:MAG: site-2 protease family protein [Myxococcaceae bacterium]